MAASDSRSQLLTTAISAIYLGVLGLGTLVAGWFIWGWISPTSQQTEVAANQLKLPPRNNPTVVGVSLDVQRTLHGQMTTDQLIQRSIEERLQELERLVRSKISGKPFAAPSFVATEFDGVGIAPQQFKRRFKDSTTEVSRYVAAGSAPRFTGQRAFDHFLTNATTFFLDSFDNRVQARLENMQIDGDKISATVVVESAGARDQTKDEWEITGRQKLALQSTAVWQTTWSRDSDSRYVLNKVAIQAVERAVLSLNSTRLFFDCTESILSGCDVLRGQLAYGLDQWAAKLPGVDVAGHQGLAVGDLNGDGMDDIYVCQPRGLPNLFLQQKKNGTVVDKSEMSSTNLLDDSRAALIVDLDNDGDKDLAVATTEALLLLSNDGTGKFQLENELTIARRGISLAAADYDNDGDVDLFLCRQLEHPTKDPTIDSIVGTSLLLRNDELFQFGIAQIDTRLPEQQPLIARSAVWHDRDNDGDQDLDVVADELGHLVFENKNGQLVRSGLTNDRLPDSRGRSVSVGDFNGDGRSDLLVASRSSDQESCIHFGGQMEGASPYCLRKPVFNVQTANTSAVTDVNNDGRDDLVFGNGRFTRIARNDVAPLLSDQRMIEQAMQSRLSIESRQPQRCFVSIGAKGFADMSSASGINFPEDARSIVTTDWDHDGDTDVIVLSRTGPQLRVFINVLNRRNSVSFELTGKDSNRDAIGARVELFLVGASAPIVKTVQAGNGCRSQSSAKLQFGVGDAKKVDAAVVHWPSGLTQTFSKLSVGSNYQLVEGNQSLTEKVNNRFRLVIRNSLLGGSLRIPMAEQPVALQPPFSLPALDVQCGPECWSSLRFSDQKHTIALVWGQNSESDNALTRFDRLAEEIKSKAADTVALFVGDESLGDEAAWQYASSFGEKLEHIENQLVLTQAGGEQLKVLCGHLFSRLEIPQTPLVLLIDRQQRLVGIYPADALKQDTLLEDIDSCVRASSQGLNQSILPGMWASQVSPVRVDRLRDQLQRAGYTLASESLNSAIERNSAIRLVQQARDLMLLQRFDLAQQLCEKSLRMVPESPYALLASADLVVQKLVASVDDFPVDASAELDLARQQYEQVIQAAPDRWQASTGLAKLMLMQGDTVRAREVLQTYLKRDSQCAEVQAMYGRICFQVEDYGQAKRYLGFAYDQRPALPFLAGDLGTLYLTTGEQATALKLLRIAHDLQPTDVQFSRLLAEAEFTKGNFHKAVDLYRQVSRQFPDQPETKNILAWLLATCPYETKRDGAAAIELLAPESGDLSDKDPATLEIYAACFAEIGDFETAIKYQQQAVDRTSTLAQTSYSKSQMKGLLTRLELYRSQQPYRTADTSQTPVAAFQSERSTFNALRF